MSTTPRTPDDERVPKGTPARPRGSGALLVPPAIVLAIALVGSVSIHLPIYAGLGVLARLLESEPSPGPSRPIEISLLEPNPSEIPSEALPDETATAVEDTPPDEETPVEEAAPEPPRRRRRAPPPEPEPEPERAPEPEPEPPPPVPVPAAEPPPPPPPPPPDERTPIVQHNEDPPVEPPPDARFTAEQSRDVEEETVASVTNMVRDDAQPSPGAQQEPVEAPTEEPGNAQEDEIADMRDVEGDDRRRALPEETERPPPREREASTSRRPTAAGAESMDRGHDREAREGERARSEEGGARAMGGGAPVEQETITVSDGFGSFTITRPRATTRPEGSGEGEAGGARREGRGRGEAGEGLAIGRSGRTRGGARRGGETGVRGGPGSPLSWSQFESIYGEEELRRQREARLEERRSRSRGASRERRWQEFRAAIENFVSEVRPGNQTALDAAASPFATFLSDMHRRIHREFADRYLASIGPDASEGLNDMSLNTTLEISVNPDGTVHRVGIVATSGNILFDFGAFNSVMRAQPFPQPPDAILSGDGRAWLHWRFDRSPRQCHPTNARPFMLRNGSGTGAQVVDRGEPPEEIPSGE
ncbi:TonB C-terminal domain-containing protein [Sandaracinus amylolyticus]|uniref:Exopolysaccharide biosynthesis domain protein n=1 Tax=Sandaracinus amylolyticus TaxID=927083 RepID=A0A0F6W3V6_9BACT|nr:TonB C-terminal domain-containing protein [Sandaracinus amylolyticus]AKF06717.1 Exopolysaccharide biosynthesis domain protein [Sandaracinus amylolyticus]